MYGTHGRFRWHKEGETPAADLLRECGQKLTDRVLWTKFQERFQGLIFLYLMRALRLRRIQDDVSDIVPDHQRQMTSEKRRAQVIPIESAKPSEVAGFRPVESPEFDSNALSSILSW